MKGRRLSLLQFLFVALCASVLLFAFTPSAQVQQGSAKVSTTKRGGLQTAIFDTLDGRVIVNLPEDMMAGDTISGTVMVEPKGQTQAEIDKSTEDRSLSMELLFDSFATIKIPASGGSRETFTIKIPANTGNEKAAGRMKLAVKGSDGASSYVNFDYGFWEYHVAATNETLGQQGRPVEIPGNFDGSFENTKVTVGGREVSVLAESPRKAIFESPRNLVGPAEIVIQEGKVETKKAFRNFGIRLSAPKTTLLKGESTTLTIKVEGLQGIKEDVPLHLENASPAVVRIEGGDQQTFRITPSMQSDGTFSTTRTIASQQAGSFSVSATVVVFNNCLQDDTQPARLILWDTFTGDYSFCRLDSKPGSSDARVRTDGVMDFSGGVVLATSDTLELTKPGSGVLTFQSNNTDRKVIINLSAGVGPPSGSATIETVNPKQTFTIRDRDTRDNTCTCN